MFSLHKVEWAARCGTTVQVAGEKFENNCYEGVEWLRSPVSCTQTRLRPGSRCGELVERGRSWTRVDQNSKSILVEKKPNMKKPIQIDIARFCLQRESWWAKPQRDEEV